jgi:putative ABC transport system substrate-binding protein
VRLSSRGETGPSRRIKLLAVLLVLSGTAAPAPASAEEVLAVRGSGPSVLEAAVEAFRSTLSSLPPPAGPKRIGAAEVAEFALSALDPVSALRREVDERRPAAVLAVGGAALEAALRLPDDTETPIVYLLAPGGSELARGNPRVTGVNTAVPPARVLRAVHALLPGIQRAGVVFDPSRSGPPVAEARKEAEILGLALLDSEARAPNEVGSALGSLSGRVDALWMLPDLTVVTPETVASFALFSVDNRVPLIAFSQAYLRKGATLSVDADPEGMADQAARLVWRILSGASPAEAPPEPPERIRISVGRRAAERLGLRIPPEASPSLKWLE